VTLTSQIKECEELSGQLRKILSRAGIGTFTKLASLSRQGLIERVPKLKVRHLSDLEHQLQQRKLTFVPDNSIRFDQFINQAKLYALWEQGVTTYKQLDALTHQEFVAAVGGPESGFFRRKAAARDWMKEHQLSLKRGYHLPHLTPGTAELLYKGGLTNLREVAQKSDYELSLIIQGNTKRARPLTRARLIEIKYAFFKVGINRSCKPL